MCSCFLGLSCRACARACAPPQELANLLWSLATAHRASRRAAAPEGPPLAATAAPPADSPDELEAAEAREAAGPLHPQWRPWLRPLLERRFAPRARRLLRRARGQEVSSLAWALSRLGHRSAGTVQALAVECQARAAGLKPQALSVLAYSLATMAAPCCGTGASAGPARSEGGSARRVPTDAAAAPPSAPSAAPSRHVASMRLSQAVWAGLQLMQLRGRRRQRARREARLEGQPSVAEALQPAAQALAVAAAARIRHFTPQVDLRAACQPASLPSLALPSRTAASCCRVVVAHTVTGAHMRERPRRMPTSARTCALTPCASAPAWPSPPQGLSNVLWALPRLGHCSSKRLLALAARNALLRLPDTAPLAWATLLEAWAAAGLYSRPLFAAVATTTAARAGEFTPRTLCRLLAALGAAQHGDPRVFAAAAAALLAPRLGDAPSQVPLDELSTGALARLARAFAAARVPAPRLARALAQRMDGRAARLRDVATSRDVLQLGLDLAIMSDGPAPLPRAVPPAARAASLAAGGEAAAGGAAGRSAGFAALVSREVLAGLPRWTPARAAVAAWSAAQLLAVSAPAGGSCGVASGTVQLAAVLLAVLCGGRAPGTAREAADGVREAMQQPCLSSSPWAASRLVALLAMGAAAAAGLGAADARAQQQRLEAALLVACAEHVSVFGPGLSLGPLARALAVTGRQSCGLDSEAGRQSGEGAGAQLRWLFCGAAECSLRSAAAGLRSAARPGSPAGMRQRATALAQLKAVVRFLEEAGVGAGPRGEQLRAACGQVAARALGRAPSV